MRETQLTLPEIGLIAATRGMLGAGVALLLGDQLPQSARKPVGWTLLSLGVLSTVPLALTVFGRSRHCDARSEERGHRLEQPEREPEDQVAEQTVLAGL
jgi:hypothetical protein